MKKKIIAGFAAAMAVVIGLGSYLFFRVEAQGVLTGLEEKVTDKVNKKEKFQIVEIVPNGGLGEIGCLVNKADQDLVQQYMNTYITSANQNTQKVRKDCVDQLRSVYAYAIGDPASKPMTMEQEYKEAYFLTDIEDTENPENWKTLEFSQKNYEQARLKGTYVADTEGKGAYEINVDHFDYSSKTGAYEVVFGTTERTDKKDEKIYHTPYHVIKVENDTQIMGEAGVDETQNLYYIQSYTYKGIGQEGATYAAIPDSKKPYYYVGENGTYTFLQDKDLLENDVEIGRIYYKFGLENHDWFRTKVLASKDSRSLDIEVSTIPESELSKDENPEKIKKADFIYVCGDIQKSKKTYQDDGAKVWSAIGEAVSKRKVPCMIDASTQVWKQCGTYQEGYTGQADDVTDYVKENVYIYGSQKPEERQAFFENFETKIAEDTSALGEVANFVKQENLLRSGEEKLSTDLTRAFLLQYIIDYSQQRSLGVKDSFRVLEIQPTMVPSKDTPDTEFELTTAKVAQWAGVQEGTDIVIDSMSTAEFIGKIDDLNTEYDLIYIGACIDYLNTTGSGKNKKTVYNDSRMNGLIYTHTGDYILGKPNISGMLDTDYGAAYVFGEKSRDNNYYLYDNFYGVPKYIFLKNRTSYTNELLTQELKKVSTQTKYANLKITFDDLCGDLSVYRYSGNDITKTKLADLLEYVNANYPVVVSDALYNMDANGTKTVNEDTVDNTSYLYQFLSKIQGEENVFSVSQVNDGNSEVGTYLNLPKLEILYFDPDTPEGEMKAYEGIDTKAGDPFNKYKSNMKVDTSNADNTGTYTVKVGFYLDSNVDASAASVYIPKFYLDLNADGKFLESGKNGSSEQMSCVIKNVDTGVEAPKDDSGKYQLTSRVRYRLEREIPSTYLGVLSWKLEMVQAANESIRTSDIQYTKIDGIGKEEVVKVLQITSQSSSGNSNNLINLATDETIRDYLEQVKTTTGLKFEIDTVGGGDFGNNEAKSAEKFYSKKLPETGKSLEDYDMLILGFADMYYDISNEHYAVDAINLFIKSGKSVLFSHDVTSFINVNPDHSFKNVHIGLLDFNNINQEEWGYYMNENFRSVLGMDRYGIASDTNASDSEELREQSELLRQGQHLTVDVQTGQPTVNQCINTKNNNRLEYFVTRGLKTVEKLSSERDIAYAAKTYNSENGTAQAYGQTHGFTNALLNWYLLPSGYTENSGNPYLNLKNSLLKNNSDGQVNAKVTKENDGLITHFPFEIGDSFRTAKTHFQYYQLHMDQDVDGDDSGDVVVWYCLSDDANSSTSDAGRVYRTSPNDARNNYYIYNIGNVTYTGMGHSKLEDSGSDLEIKLFVNTIVAAYKAGVESPSIKILEGPEKSSYKKKYEYITYDAAASGTSLTNDVDFYFTISDPNLTPSKKTMTVEFSYYDGTEYVNLGADQIAIVDVTTNTPVTGNYTDGHVYKATLKDAAGKLAELEKTGNGSLEIKAKLNSSFDYYGRHESHYAETSLTILKMSLFELN